jgi:hypothetical protein
MRAPLPPPRACAHTRMRVQVYSELKMTPARELSKPAGAPAPLQWDVTPTVKDGTARPRAGRAL